MTGASTTPKTGLDVEIAQERARLDRVSEIVGYRFSDESLLLQALTHKSLRNERQSAVGDGEALELLGDAVLSLLTLDALFLQTPDAQEGELTDRRAAFVSEDALAQKADALGLVPLLRTGRSIAGRVPHSVKADVIECLLGAVYRDAGLEAARQVARRLLGEPPQHATILAAHAKRVLQERLLHLFGEPPSYDVERGAGPNHDPSYRAVARFRGASLGEGMGRNKRLATEAAAAHALVELASVSDAQLIDRFKSGQAT